MRRRLFIRLGLIGALILVGLTGLSGPVNAQTKSFSVDSWETSIVIAEDGTFRVTETQAVRFNGSFSFYTRSIPHQRLDDITDIRVTDVTGDTPLVSYVDYTVSEGFSGANPSTDIRLDFAITDAVQTWQIEYTVEGGVGFFDNHDELYWNAIPSDRSVAIEDVRVQVTLPPGASADTTQTTFFESGVAGATAAVIDDQTVLFMGGPALPYTDFTIVVGWPTGLVLNPGIIRVESSPDNTEVIVDGVNSGLTTPVGLRRGRELIGPEHSIAVKKYGVTSQPSEVNVERGQTVSVSLSVFDTFFKKLLVGIVIAAVGLYALMPAWLALLLYLRWRKTGRDPKGRGTIIAEFEAPDGSPPGVVGTLIDERADTRDLSATMIDLAIKGYMTIKELEKKTFKTQDYVFIKQREWSNAPELSKYEKDVLEEIFGSGSKEEKKLSDLKNKFYKSTAKIQKELYREVVKRGYYERNPEKRRKKYSGWGVLMLTVGGWATFFYGLGLPVFVASFVVFIFARLAPQRTKKGVLAKEHSEGLRLYIDTAEKYVVRKMTPEIFEKYLPYAMVFKIERRWAKKFEPIFKEYQPAWYQTTTPNTAFSAMALTNAVSAWSTAAGSTLTSRPGGSSGSGGFASGSSGFSGGFSGGGGGGGGISAG